MTWNLVFCPTVCLPGESYGDWALVRRSWMWDLGGYAGLRVWPCWLRRAGCFGQNFRLGVAGCADGQIFLVGASAAGDRLQDGMRPWRVAGQILQP